jgi:Flp pilus assembly protein protease CpaA
VYAFSPDEQEISCCACVVTPNALVSLSAKSDLISNTLTPAVPNSIVVKLLATNNGACNAAAPAALATGLAAWGTTLHATPTAGAFAVTETAFTPATLGAAELARISALCGFIQSNGSGFGICRSCRLGGQGAAKL